MVAQENSKYSGQSPSYNHRDHHSSARPAFGGNQRVDRPFDRNNPSRSSAEAEFKEHPYDPKWITEGADEALVSYAEWAGKFMAKNNLTNSKIRNIYGEIKRIQMGEFDREKSAFFLLKPKVAYALGRDKDNEGLKLFKLIFDRCSQDVSNQKSYQNFCGFIEAILAYHRANGGKD
jgi:CRISPR-associated protein Csm2